MTRAVKVQARLLEPMVETTWNLFVAVLFLSARTLCLVRRDRFVALNLEAIVAGRCCDASRSSVGGTTLSGSSDD